MRKIYQIHFIIVSIVLLSSFKHNEKLELIGTWEYRVGYFEYTLKLNQDSTYTHTIVGDLNKRKSTGVWKAKGQNLILNSHKQKPVEFEVTSYYDSTVNGIVLKIQNETGEPVCTPQILFITDNIKIDSSRLNIDGVFRFPHIDGFSSFEIKYLGCNVVTWQMDDSNNVYNITMMRKHDSYIYQTNEKWEIKGNRLYSPSSKNDKQFFKSKALKNYYIKEED